MKWLRKLFAPAPAALQCEICGGHGRVAVWSGISNWPPVTSMVVCAECKGTGRAAGVKEGHRG
jgi:DnaJ-class molecular chaperone